MENSLDKAVKVATVINSLLLLGGLVFAGIQLDLFRRQNAIQAESAVELQRQGAREAWVTVKSFEAGLLREFNSLDPRPAVVFSRNYDMVVARAIEDKLWTKEEESLSGQVLRDYRQIREAQKLLNFVILLSSIHKDAFDEQTKKRFEDNWGRLALNTWEKLQPVMRYNIQVAFLPHEKKPTTDEVYADIKQLAGK